MSHQTLLITATVISRLFHLLLLLSSSRLPLFDSSPLLLSNSIFSQPLLRWDSFHFLHIAQHGYVYENEWAFLPGAPFVVRISANLLRFLFSSQSNPLIAGALAAIACDTTCTLYQLTLHHLGSPTLAYLTALLSLMPSNPATLYFVPYTEPFFTYLSYKGMLCCAQKRWMPAALLFALAGTFRSNGVLLSGFILWGLLVQQFLEHHKLSLRMLPYPTLLASIVLTPFVYHNYSGYILFCTNTQPSTSPPAWCHSFPPSIYTHAQSQYWNVGFLRYWTFAQVPNFIMAAPPLAALSLFSLYHLRYSIPLRLQSRSLRYPLTHSKPIISSSIFFHPALTPHAIHALFLSTTVLLASHVQIILRLAASMPFTYWAAVWLVTETPKLGRWWLGWSLVWSSFSVVLWGVSLPPA